MDKNCWLLQTPIAHRGLHTDDLPENSLAAFENAVKKGFPIETDVRVIDDGTVIVFHDDKLARMTGNDGYASTLKSEDLRDLRLGGTEEIIPTFEQFLSAVNGRTPLLIELKNEGKVGDLESKVFQMLKSYTGPYAVQSFNPYSMEYFKTNAPDILRGQLSCVYDKKTLTPLKRYVLSRLKMNHVSCPDFISYDVNALPSKYVAKTGLPVLAWTVRSNTEAEKAAEYCDNIIFEKFVPEPRS